MSRAIVLGLWAQVALLVPSACALLFDTRTILGANPWMKPIKFELSLIILLATCGLLLDRLPPSARWIAWLLAVGSFVEAFLIALQSARGVRSHMNVGTAFDGGVVLVMLVAVVVILIGIGALCAMYFIVVPTWPPVLVLAARLGLLVLIVGSIEGFVMIHNGGHTIGASDGGAGLPFVGWSRTHGDLRVAHFAAIHSLQVFLFAGFVLSRLRVPQPSLILIGVAVGYTCLCIWLFRWAMLGNAINS